MIEKREKIEQYAILFCIYAFVGWVYEVFLWAKDYHMYINRGFCFGPWLPVYGFGGLLILYFLGKRDWNPVIKFLSISAFAALIELIATYILDLIGIGFHALWNYDDNLFNFQGRIALWPAMKFGIIAMIILGLQPLIEKAIEKKYVKYVMLVLFGLFVIDIIFHLATGSNYKYDF